jgi:hypothetical protein
MQLIFLFQLLFLFYISDLSLGEFGVYMYQHFSVEDLCPLLCL